MSANRIRVFFQNNVVLISGVGIIIATHWGWNRLQNNPRLVPEDKKRELPIIIALRYLSKSTMEKFNALTAGSQTPKVAEKK